MSDSKINPASFKPGMSSSGGKSSGKRPIMSGKKSATGGGQKKMGGYRGMFGKRGK